MKKEKIFQNRLFESLSKFKAGTAIEYGGREMTYEELDSKSNAMSNWIVSKGIKKETFIGILMDDRIEVIVATLGIIKAGCVIVPLYSGYPNERIKAMVDETHLKYIFIDRRNARRFEGGGALPEEGELIFIEEFYSHEEVLPFMGKPGPGVQYSPEDKLYIHFTSGTTGIPKAVMGKNKSILHFIDWEIETFNIDSEFRVAQFTIPGFDPFLRDTFVPLFSGGVICIPEKEEILINAEELIQWTDKQRIGLIHCVSSLFRLMSADWLTPDYFKALKVILLAGEKINPVDLVHWYEVFGDRTQLVNCYGPTETTQSKVYYLIKPSDVNRERIPIGKPLKGCRIIILDPDMQVCDPLEAGEIYIRTPYRSHGYYNSPGLNKMRFMQNPFNDDPDDILYRSGDLGRFLLDGNIDILGRVDRQVKIRGYRVELEEIEAILSSHEAVKEAVVIKTESTGNNEMLCAYITEEEGEEDCVEQTRKEEAISRKLREYLFEKIPDYMVPVTIVKLDKIPRKATGKVDFDRLPDPLQNKAKDYTPPRSHVESVLLKLWTEILGIERIGINDRFIELGGNSLNVMTLISRIHREFDIRLSLGEIFKNSTIEMQAMCIKEAKIDKFISIRGVEEKEYYALSSAQRRLHIIQQLEPGITAYNIPFVLEVEGKLDSRRLENAFKELISRHESFRTSFEDVGGETVQRIYENVEFSIEHYKVGAENRVDNGADSFAGEAEEIIKNFMRPFRLSHPPLLRVGLIHHPAAPAAPAALPSQDGDLQEKQILMVDMHHIVSDGETITILIKDFMALYHGKVLTPLGLQYKDFAEWQNKALECGEIKKQGEYWLERFKGEIPVLNIPTDYPRPSIQRFEGKKVAFAIDDKLTEDIKALAAENGATLYMVMLAVFTVMLAKYSGQSDIIIGTPVAGRRHLELENIAGMFVNVVLIRNDAEPEKRFGDFLTEVKDNVIQAFENQDYQFDQLAEQLNVKRDRSRNPLYDVIFALENADTSGFRLPDLKLRPYPRPGETSKTDLRIGIFEVQGKIVGRLSYSTSLFKRETAEEMAEHYVDILKQVVEDRRIQLKNITVSHDMVMLTSSALRHDESEFGF